MSRIVDTKILTRLENKVVFSGIYKIKKGKQTLDVTENEKIYYSLAENENFCPVKTFQFYLKAPKPKKKTALNFSLTL